MTLAESKWVWRVALSSHYTVDKLEIVLSRFTVRSPGKADWIFGLLVTIVMPRLGSMTASSPNEKEAEAMGIAPTDDFDV